MAIDHIIVGGGISGVSIATLLLQRGAPFLLLEGSPRLGGKVETRLTREACLEFGPNSFTNQTEEIFTLLELLGLRETVITPSAAARNRYILKQGKMVRLPSSPPEIFTTKSLSLKGKLRLLSEAFYVPKRKKDEESVHDFFLRHFGREVADYFADPFVSGIFAGSASRLLLKSSFPMMAEAEANSSSLIRYLLSKRKTAKASPKSYQLKNGLESIFHAALKKMGTSRVHLSEKVLEIFSQENSICVVTEKTHYTTKTLYMTAPAYVAATCMEKGFPKLAAGLANIEYAPVVTVHLRVSKQERYPFDGFGILFPSIEKRKILGVLWNSSTFPELFGDQEHHYLTVYVGGMQRVDLALANPAELERVVQAELMDIFDLKSAPEFLGMRRHDRAIPQYTRSHGAILKSLQTLLLAHPAVKLAGNYLAGVSIPRTVTHAMRQVV